VCFQLASIASVSSRKARNDGSDCSYLKLAAAASFFHCENGSRMHQARLACHEYRCGDDAMKFHVARRKYVIPHSRHALVPAKD
jgi:hypothetical protein